MEKILNILIILTLILVPVAIFFTVVIELNTPVGVLINYFYWWLLLFWIFIMKKVKQSIDQTFVLSLRLFILAALLSILGFEDIAEFIMRCFFEILIIGLLAFCLSKSKYVQKFNHKTVI